MSQLHATRNDGLESYLSLSGDHLVPCWELTPIRRRIPVCRQYDWLNVPVACNKKWWVGILSSAIWKSLGALLKMCSHWQKNLCLHTIWLIKCTSHMWQAMAGLESYLPISRNHSVPWWELTPSKYKEINLLFHYFVYTNTVGLTREKYSLIAGITQNGCETNTNNNVITLALLLSNPGLWGQYRS